MAAQNSKFKLFSGILRCLLCVGSLPSDPTTDIPTTITTTTTTTDVPTTTTTTDVPTTTTTTPTQVKTPGVVARLMGLDSLPESKKVSRRKEGQTKKGFLRPKSREPKEKAKEITRKMRGSLCGEPMDLPSILEGYAGDESSYNVSGSDSGSELELTISTPRKSFHRSNRPRPSFVSREAKKRHSERWKMSQRYQNVGAVGKASRPENFYPMTGLDGSSDRFVSNNEIAEWDSPLGISLRDGWKDSIRISSPSRYLAASCISFGGPKTNMQCETLVQDSYLMAGEAMNRGKNKAIRRNSNKKEDCSSRKIRSNNKKSQSSRRTYRGSTDSFGEEQFNLSQVEINLGKKDPAEQNSLVSHMRTHNINGKSSINDAEVDGGHADMYSESLDEELPSKPSSCLLGNPTSSTPGPEDSKAQDSNADGLMLTPSDKDVGQGFVSVSEDNEVFNDESWESVYLADVLIDSGYDDADPDTFVSTWYSLDCPLDPRLFDNVEEKYSNETTSLRSERKLLFDRINSGLFEMFHQFVDPLPWVKQPTGKVGLTRQKHGIGYELHKLLASEEKSMHEDVTERVLDREMQWLDPGDGVDAIGMEIEKLLMDDLIVEVANMLSIDQNSIFEMSHQFVDPLPWVKQPTGKVGLTRQKHGIGYELHKLLASEEKSMHEDVTERVLDREMQWLDAGDGVDAIGMEIEKLLMDDLIVEAANMLSMDQNSILGRARDKRMELNGMEYLSGAGVCTAVLLVYVALMFGLLSKLESICYFGLTLMFRSWLFAGLPYGIGDFRREAGLLCAAGLLCLLYAIHIRLRKWMGMDGCCGLQMVCLSQQIWPTAGNSRNVMLVFCFSVLLFDLNW
ncbi:unnamed protein product [Camellia sinensis]